MPPVHYKSSVGAGKGGIGQVLQWLGVIEFLLGGWGRRAGDDTCH